MTAIITIGKPKTLWQSIEAVIIMYIWAKVGKTKDFRKLDASKEARPDFTERCGGSYLPSTLPKKEYSAVVLLTNSINYYF